MGGSTGPPPPSLMSLPRIEDRLTFVHAEHCVVHRADNALTLRNARGTVHIPATMMVTLILGPGSTVSHQAMVLIGQMGTGIVWAGDTGVRLYASGRSLAQSNRVLKAQARCVVNRSERITVARRMYDMRFPGEDLQGLTMQQLRGREGARMRRLYGEHARRTGVEWHGRDYVPDDFDSSDPINQALSAANAALYGVVHCAILGVGASPGLGIVHDGHDLSFVYDIADLYKAEISIPIAFDCVADDVVDIGSSVRRRMRDAMAEAGILRRCVRDTQVLLGVEDGVEMAEIITLWDFQQGQVAAGTNHGYDA